MRLKRFLVYALVIVVGFSSGMLLGRGIEKPKNTVAIKEPDARDVLAEAVPRLTLPPPIATPAPTAANEKYLLMLSGESICIYALLQDGTTDLIQKTEVDTAQLRGEDYANLCRGIQVSSLDEARGLCEDFGG